MWEGWKHTQHPWTSLMVIPLRRTMTTTMFSDGWSSYHTTLHRWWLIERCWTSHVQCGICPPSGPGFLPRNFNLSMFFWFLFFWKFFWKLECKEVSWKKCFEMRSRWVYPSSGIQWENKSSPCFSFFSFYFVPPTFLPFFSLYGLHSLFSKFKIHTPTIHFLFAHPPALLE